MKKQIVIGNIITVFLFVLSFSQTLLANDEMINLSQWHLKWSDEFNYSNKQLDQNWISQNGPTENEWVLSSRWRDNAVVKDGVLHLMSKKENRGGQEWTTGNVWSKRAFHYGYFEARYKYAGAYGTNNSFWFWPKQGVPEGEIACEIDINEGHYPNVWNTNIHNWTNTYTLPNGRVSHADDHVRHTVFGQPDHTIALAKPIKTKKLRLLSKSPGSIHLSEFRVFAPSSNGYPEALDSNQMSELTNFSLAQDVTFTTSGALSRPFSKDARSISKDKFAIDGLSNTRWISEKGSHKFIELNWNKEKTIGAIQFINGLLHESGPSKGIYSNLITEYQIEYHDGEKWIEITNYDSVNVADFSEEYHTYGLSWDEDYFKFYFDDKLYRTVRNDGCFSETTVLFSLAILKAAIAGPVSDDIDGTSMAIDWVRYYTKKP
ncbi:family 16 glycosylhydrolase [Colwellia sp. UCD-KL20]|uniref:family 16 glycosylhydrolase n=1 Tax=Colwellia sp. UCD-KL20 TaxID=1917165 RepID=UPI000970B69B|nr:family 16 glycosylhydrolase [Colwellia sp. UCD-KL20]